MWITEQRQYDAYGNLVAEVDGAGRTQSTVYGEFGRRVAEIDAGGRQKQFDYDEFGNLTHEYRPVAQTFSNTGWNQELLDQYGYAGYALLYQQWALEAAGAPDIRREYDEAGRLTEVHDLKTGVNTVYHYDLKGERVQEDITGTGGHDRHLTYSYDAAGQMTRWADSVTGMHLNYLWDAAGNEKRVYTDAGYAHAVNHWYEYDQANRLTSMSNGQGGSVISGYGYDEFGNRTVWNNAGVIVSYQYDDNGRVIAGQWTEGGANWSSTWTYDEVGNLLTYLTSKNGQVQTEMRNTYSENHLTLYSYSDSPEGDPQETWNSFDAGQRLTQVQTKAGGKTTTYSYFYYADGREREIQGRGAKKAGGSTTFTYDANDKQIRVDKGKGDGMDRREVLTFVYSNDGQILYRFHDEGSDDKVHGTEYQYANANPVGERKTQNGQVTELLDSGQYNRVQNLGEDYPSSAVTSVTVVEGDTLQSIAARLYGNPSLWFILAEANGIDPSQPLKAGTKLTVPTTVQSGALSADAHTVYNESDIIGSTLPNLKTPKKKGCGNILAIIVVVIIAVVIAIFAAPLLAGLGTAIGGLLGGGAVATFVGGAIAAGIVAAAASIVSQGLLIAMGYQEKFSWKAVGQAAVTGAFTFGIGQVAGTASTAVGQASNWAKVAQVAIRVASNAAVQYVQNGKITSWASLAASAVGSAGDTFGAEGSVLRSVGDFVQGDTFNQYASPWIDAAETYIRTGELTPADWASAVGRTLSAATSSNGRSESAFPGLNGLDTKIGRTALQAGVMAFIDRDAAAQYFASGVGQEVGGGLGAAFRSGFKEGQERATEAEENRKRSTADATRLNANAGLLPTQQVMAAPQASTGEQTDLLFEKELETEFLAQNQQQLDILADELSKRPITLARAIEPDETFWSMAREDLGQQASNAEVQERVYQYIAANKDVDPRVLMPGTAVTIPSTSQPVSQDDVATYMQSNAELNEYYAERAAAQTQTAQPMASATTDDPNSFSGTLALAQQTGLSMDEILTVRSGLRGAGATGSWGRGATGSWEEPTLGERISNWADEKLSQLNDAVHHPVDAVIGAGKALVNTVPSLLELMAKGQAQEDINNHSRPN